MPRPRVAIDLSILETPHWTGVERRAVEIARRLPEAMPEADVLALAPAPSPRLLETLGYDLASRPSRLPGRFWRRLRLRSELHRLGADLLLVPVARAPRVAGVRSVRTLHDLPLFAGGEPHEAPGALERRRLLRDLRRPMATIAVSEATAADYHRLVPAAETPFTVIENGVADAFLDAPPSPRPPVAGPNPYFLVVGTLRERRRPDLLEAAARFSGRALLWAGPATEAAVRRFPTIRFLGAVDDPTLLALMDHAEGLVLSSSREGGAIPAFEAAARGRRVLVLDRRIAPVLGDLEVDWAGEATAPALAGLLGVSGPCSESKARAGRNAARVRRRRWAAVAAAHADFFRDLIRWGAASDRR